MPLFHVTTLMMTGVAVGLPIHVIVGMQELMRCGHVSLLSPDSGLQVEQQLAILSQQLSALIPVHLQLVVGNRQPRFDSRDGTTLHVLHGNVTRLPRYFSKMSSSRRFVNSPWLISLGSRVRVEDVFRDVNLFFDSKVHVARAVGGVWYVEEAYRVDVLESLQVRLVASWSLHRGFFSFRSRRENLRGVVIQAATMHNPPTVIIEDGSNGMKIKGLFGNIWHILESHMQFTTELVIPTDGVRGTKRSDGTYDGMVRMILEGNVSVAIDAFGMSEARSSVVDFTSPLVYTKYGIFVRMPESKERLSDSFLAPFSWGLWLATALLPPVAASSLALSHWLGRVNGVPLGPREPGRRLGEAVLYCLGVLCQQGQIEEPGAYSSRVLCLSVWVGHMVLLAAYSATLVSFLTVHRYEIPFTDLESLLSENGFTFQMLSQNSITYFSNATQYIMAAHLDTENPVPSTELSGLVKVCETKYALLIPLHAAVAHSHLLPCSVVALPRDVSEPIEQGFVVSKDWQYKEILNYNLLKLKTAGILEKHKAVANSPPVPPDEDDWNKVTMAHSLPVFSILVAGFVISLILLFIEKLWWNITYLKNEETVVTRKVNFDGQTYNE